MLETVSPPNDHELDPVDPAVPLPVSQHVSRSSTPGISSLDGTPRYLDLLSIPPPPPPAPPALTTAATSPPLPPRQLLPPDLGMTFNPTPQLGPRRLHGHDYLIADEDALILDERTLLSPTVSAERRSPAASPTRTAVPDEDCRPIVSLSEMTHLLRLQKYQKRCSHHSRERLHYLQVAAARANRVACAARSIQHTLAECIRAEDKASFVSLSNAFQDACDSALKPTSESNLENDSGWAQDVLSTASFLEELSASSKASILEFLARIRYNSAFVADRLISLSQKELLGLLSENSVARSSESVIGGYSGLRSRTSRPLGYVVDSQVDNVSTFTYSSSLEALIFATRGVTRNGRFLDERATKAWAEVCAQLISHERPGSEKVVPAVLDVWAASVAWPGKDRLEIWILQTLQRGAFLLEHSGKQSFRARVEGRSDISVDEEARAEQFLTQTAHSLLVLLSESAGPSVLPPGALKMCTALNDSLSYSPRHQGALSHFIITRWLFSSFIPNVIIAPEAYDMVTDHFISENSRQRILREVVSRAQKAVFDATYSWKTGVAVSFETAQCVKAIMARIRTSSADRTFSRASHTPEASPADLDDFVVLSAKDVLLSIHALYPQRRPASVASDGDSMAAGLMSSSSSVSGFSLFRNSSETDLYSGIRPAAAQTKDAPLTTESELDTDDKALFTGQIRDASLELEDLVSSHSTGSSKLWDVLYAPARSQGLEMMQRSLEKCLDSQDHIGAPSSLAQLTGRHSRSAQFVSCAKMVESLLRDSEKQLRCQSPPPQSYSDRAITEPISKLESMFEQSIEECEARSDFVQAYHWYKQLQDFRDVAGSSLDDKIPVLDLLHHIESATQASLARAERSTDLCEKWIKQLDSVSELRKGRLGPIAEQNERLRDKLWYVVDIRTTAAFEEARSITAALRVMGKTKRLPRPRTQPPLRHWNGSKLSASSKTEAQILEILSARPEHGGPNKLGDEQSRAMELWMDRQNIDNICRGEERLHKLCMEVRRCVDSIMGAPNENSTIWSNPLFAQDLAIREYSPPSLLRKSALQGPLFGTGQHTYLSLQTQLRSNDALSSTSRTLSSASSRDYFDTRSPALTNKSSIPFWSPAMTEIESRSSATSVNLSRTQSTIDSSPRKGINSTEFPDESKLDVLRQRALSLLLSDLSSTLFNDGSETDRAFWTGLGWTITERHFRSIHALQSSMESQTPNTASESGLPPYSLGFNFETAFSTLLEKFSVVTSPYTKLACLSNIDKLLVPYMATQSNIESPPRSFGQPADPPPRTQVGLSEGDASVDGFRHIFTKNDLRPSTIFRDLQYIAALLPSSALQSTPEGKSFFNAAMAVSGLKREARSLMVETADGIIAYHSNNRGHGRSPSMAQQQRDSAIFATPSRTPSAEDVSRYSMADAAYLLQITAKEGDAVAQRELATLYLTHPELMEPVIAPFSRPRDVFKDELEGKWRKNQDPNRCDPSTMCVAHHWMSLSSKGGDSLAKEYLRQREEMDSF